MSAEGPPCEEVVAGPPRGTTFDAFPFQPYHIQLELMRHIYRTLECGGVGVFESPTGTGKTLSLLCATLTWLEDAMAAAADPPPDTSVPPPADDEPEWMREHGRGAAKRQAAELLAERCARRERIRKAATSAQTGGSLFTHPARPAGGAPAPAPSGDADAEFLLDDDWDSEQEGECGRKRRGTDADSSLRHADSDSEGAARVKGAQVEEEDEYEPLQVIFCSRTHSQLAQVVGELSRTRFAARFRCVTLAGRAVMCVNEGVQALAPPAQRLNDRCRDLQAAARTRTAAKPAATSQPGKAARSKASAGCPFLAKRKGAVAALREHILHQPLEVEEVTRAGRTAGACPYYAARAALPAAHIVLLPYAALLQQEMREALGIRLSGAVVIVDEAHNLPEAVASAHSAVLGGASLASAAHALEAYMARYRSRLAAGNARHLATLLTVAKALQRATAAAPAGGGGRAPDAERVARLNDFLFEHGIDHINLFKLGRYCRESKVLFKVGGFGDAQAAAAAAAGGSVVVSTDADPLSASSSSVTNALQALLAFVSALTAAEADGRVLCCRADSSPGAPHPRGRLKFLLLAPSARFAPIAAACRALILAGGTLGPPRLLAGALFPCLPPGRLQAHACGHIVPPEHLLALALGQGPTGMALDYSYQARSSSGALDELARLLLNVCRCVPQGVVAFFPSFEYADACCARWAATGAAASLAALKTVFREPRTASAVEALLERYAAAATGPTGALLLCVVGGKLSEGINFSDGLGRGVVLVGLPYAPPNDAELSERMRWLDGATPEQGGGPGAGRAYYEALCMRAVNQSIGRAIRHAGDYAAIVLADARWTRAAAEGGVAGKLPAWMAQSLVTVKGPFGEAVTRMHRFFRERKAEEARKIAQAAE